MTGKRLEGRIVVVAGGGSGIGAATADRLAREGARVVIGDLRADSASRMAEDLRSKGAEAMGVGFDLADEASVAALVRTAIERFGGLDGIHVNGADLDVIRRDTDILDEPMEVFDRTIQVNLRGHVLCTRHALPHLLERGGGAIVYTSSGAASAGEPERPSYAISKAGLHALMRHVTSRWGKSGVRANVICPGVVLTDALKQSLNESMIAFSRKHVRHTRLGEPEDVAAMVAMLMSRDGEWITGQVLSVDGGATLRL
ncbi:MAG: SDR family oxidoreductase [Polyangiales bacterium]